VSVIGEPRIRSVPVGEQRRSGLHVGPHKSLDRSRGVVRDSGEPATGRMPPKCGAFPVQARRSPLRQTACWSKADSNRRSHFKAMAPEPLRDLSRLGGYRALPSINRQTEGATIGENAERLRKRSG
jgi:hypothetical protein